MKKCMYALLLPLCFSTALKASNCDSLQGLEGKLACYDALKQCTTLVSDSQRLACYESGNTPGKVKITASSVVDKGVDKEVYKDATTNSVFPIQGKSPTLQTEAKTIAATIERIRLNRSEIVHLFLDNGQVWKETARSRFPYKSGQKVTISKGTLGAVKLHAEGMKKYAKVSRVK